MVAPGDHAALLWNVTVAALKGILEVFLMTFAGFYLAYLQVLDPGGTKLLSKLIFHLLLPCLLFASLLESLVDLSFGELWSLPLGAVINLTASLLIGVVALWAVQRVAGALTDRIWRTAVVACVFCNANQLPILFISALCSFYEPLQGEIGCLQKATGFTSLMLLVWSVVCWSVGMPFIANARADGDAGSHHVLPSPAGYASVPASVQSDSGSGDTAHSSHHEGAQAAVQSTAYSADADLLGSLTRYKSHAGRPEQQVTTPKSESDSVVSPVGAQAMSDDAGALHLVRSTVWAVLNSVRGTPPTAAILLAIVLAQLPHLGPIILNQEAPLRLILEAQYALGYSTLTLSSLLVGGNLYFAYVRGFGNTGASMFLLVSIALVRLILVPATLISGYVALQRVGWLPQNAQDDRIKQLAILLEFSMPSANNVVAMSELAGHSQAAASAILLFQYILAPFILTGTTVGILAIIQ
ncbi:Protein PIN-LIKES 7 [Porphyridium purpureum]|uniref:Protein PIN-LIKES 7 n=1 Tax=Porphyridium purpureum TaxID=35688 RepID=A0A5J4YLX2_PORPP|nr:Protein PIN-LIKES 7 [Porphyridium purpureum]|eukprot:POR9613..scf244_11